MPSTPQQGTRQRGQPSWTIRARKRLCCLSCLFPRKPELARLERQATGSTIHEKSPRWIGHLGDSVIATWSIFGSHAANRIRPEAGRRTSNQPGLASHAPSVVARNEGEEYTRSTRVFCRREHGCVPLRVYRRSCNVPIEGERSRTAPCARRIGRYAGQVGLALIIGSGKDLDSSTGRGHARYDRA